MMNLTSSETNTNKLQFIDCIRGIAIIMVVFNHSNWYLPDMVFPMELISKYGQMGVQLFFVASAFTLCLSTTNRNGDGENLKTFYLRRYFRIAPLYYLGIAFYFIYFSVIDPLMKGGAVAASDRYSVFNVLANVFFINDFTPGAANNRVVPGGWSIGTEMTFYLLFPFLFFLYEKLKHRFWVIVSLPFLGVLFSVVIVKAMGIVAASIGFDTFYYYNTNNKFLYFNIVAQLPVFLTGMTLFYVAQRITAISRDLKIVLGFLIVGLTIVGLIVYVQLPNIISLVAFVPALSFFCLFLLYKHVPWLSNQLLARIGQLSFSIYLLHFVFVYEGSRLLPLLLQSYLSTEVIFIINFFISLIITCGLAELTEKYVEKPGIEMGRKVIKRIKNKRTVLNQIVLE